VRKALFTAVVLAAALAGFAAGVRAARDDSSDLIQVDREFDEATARGGAEAWASYFAEDGIMMPQGAPMAVGKPAVRQAAGKLFSAPGFVLRWEPIGAQVSGRLGYTYGLYRTQRPGPDGALIDGYGKYLTVWKKDRNGAWVVAVDCGNSMPAPSKTAQ